MIALRSVGVVLLLAGAAAAQTATVTNTADAGAGSLRAALLAANASAAPSFTIDVTAAATAGPIVLASVLPQVSRGNLLVRGVGAAGRLVVDARPVTSTAGYGFDVAGNDVSVTVACRFHVTSGNGLVVRGDRVTFADLQVAGVTGGSGVVTVTGADQFAVGRLDARGFQQGVFLNTTVGARIATGANDLAVVQDNSGTGIRITAGSDHELGELLVSGNGIGVSASDSPRLSIGRAGGARARIEQNGAQGVLATRCDGLVVLDADFFGNGIASGGVGVQVIDGSDVTLRDLLAEANTFGGIAIQGGADTVRIGPNVQTRGYGGAVDKGLVVWRADAVTVLDCVFGPDHTVGAQLAPEALGAPFGVTFHRCAFAGNRAAGLSVLQSQRTLLSTSVLTGNVGDGVEAIGPQDLRLFDCLLGANGGNGVLAQNVGGLLVGAGNRLLDNVSSGVKAFFTSGLVVENVPTIAGNRGSGIWLADCDGAAVRRTLLPQNRGRGIYALRCAAMAIGPDVEVRDTFGSGLQWELCENNTMFASRIRGNSAHGVHVLGALGNLPLHLRSCLIADHPGLALYHAGAVPLVTELCTIAGNLRGVVAGNNPITIDSCIVRANTLEDLQATATAMTVHHTFHLLPPPLGGSSNSAADPQFVAPAVDDWRLSATSPAIGAANPALVPAPGSLDAFGGPRTVGALDAGAYEVGPHPTTTPPRLLLSSPTMPSGGGGLAFHLEYPPSAAGGLSVLLAELGPPSGSFPLGSAVIPLGLTPALLQIAIDPNAPGALLPIGADGVVAGALLYAGLLPSGAPNQVISLCGVALGADLEVLAVSNVASFTIL